MTAKDILDLARSQIGTTASNIKRCKYNTWFYGYEASGDGYDWCAVFVSWRHAQRSRAHRRQERQLRLPRKAVRAEGQADQAEEYVRRLLFIRCEARGCSLLSLGNDPVDLAARYIRQRSRRHRRERRQRQHNRDRGQYRFKSERRRSASDQTGKLDILHRPPGLRRRLRLNIHINKTGGICSDHFEPTMPSESTRRTRSSPSTARSARTHGKNCSA